MAARGKKFRAAVAKVDRTRQYPIPDAVELVKDSSFAKFDETVDVAVQPGRRSRATPIRWSGERWCCPMEPGSRFAC